MRPPADRTATPNGPDAAASTADDTAVSGGPPGGRRRPRWLSAGPRRDNTDQVWASSAAGLHAQHPLTAASPPTTPPAADPRAAEPPDRLDQTVQRITSDPNPGCDAAALHLHRHPPEVLAAAGGLAVATRGLHDAVTELLNLLGGTPVTNDETLSGALRRLQLRAPSHLADPDQVGLVALWCGHVADPAAYAAQRVTSQLWHGQDYAPSLLRRRTRDATARILDAHQSLLTSLRPMVLATTGPPPGQIG